MVIPWLSRFVETAARSPSRVGRGEQRTQADLLIAATALENSLPLVTRNLRDFQDLGLELIDPFAPPS